MAEGGDRLVLIGTKGGPALRPKGPSPTSSLLHIAGRPIVVDCGLGVTRGLVDSGLALKDLDRIVITHLHSDHVLELGPLLHTAWTAGLSTPVRVFGPPGLETYWQGFLASLAYDIDLRIADEGRPDLRDLVAIETYGEGRVFSDGGLTLDALRVHHPPVEDCFALRFESGFESDGAAIVFSADTAYFPPLAAFARDADILVHEALYGPGVDRLVARTGNGTRLKAHLLASHTLAEDVGRIAQAAEVGHLVLHHLVPADDPAVGPADWERAVRVHYRSGRLTVGRDGLEIPIGRPTGASILATGAA